MEAIEVVARFDPLGKVVPIHFIWQGGFYLVDATGRRWQDEAGLHILVMTPGEQVYELVYKTAELCWYLVRPTSNPRTA